ncbi:group III truncated hemoglobin [Faunimonas sp. B44]|uniref:group III truncated hemoglobin n=1 Tax=Faunimonas sp. B44 TaxID=3461493 RepID=UPI004044C3CB
MTTIPIAPAPTSPEPRHEALDEDLIARVVHTFYGRVRADERLGPIFAAGIGDRWDDHLPKMCAFWSSVMMQTGRYKGRPVPAHARLEGVTPRDFALWLGLFKRTVDELCPPAVADSFMEKAVRIAQSLQLAMFFDPADIAPARPVAGGGR